MLVTITATRLPPWLTGLLSQWTVEPATGVYVGNLSPTVRDEIWQHIQGHVGDGAATLAYATPHEPGYRLRSTGANNRRQIREHDGIQLVAIASDP